MNIYRNAKLKSLSLVLFVFLLIINQANGQETKRTSIMPGIGVGYNEGKREMGLGLIYSIGWQKSFGKKDKLRLNPNLIIGNFSSFGITDISDQFYRITSLGMNLHYDLVKYKSISIVTSGGGFLNYSRGLLGRGGSSGNNINNSGYFNRLYFGVSASLGVRITPNNHRIGYELRPLNFQFGSNYFLLGYLMVGIDINLKK